MKLIDADALLEAMKDRVVIEPKYSNWIYEDSMIDLITNASTVRLEAVGELSMDYHGYGSYKQLKELPGGYHKLYIPQPKEFKA